MYKIYYKTFTGFFRVYDGVSLSTENFMPIKCNAFYLPKKYLTDTLFDLFELFSKHGVFLEIAIPSIIYNIEMDKTQYQQFSYEILWKFFNKEYIYNSLNHNHNLIINPIKITSTQDANEWLKDIFCKDNAIFLKKCRF